MLEYPYVNKKISSLSLSLSLSIFWFLIDPSFLRFQESFESHSVQTLTLHTQFKIWFSILKNTTLIINSTLSIQQQHKQTKQDMDFLLAENVNFSFFCKPYLLKLQFPGKNTSKSSSTSNTHINNNSTGIGRPGRLLSIPVQIYKLLQYSKLHIWGWGAGAGCSWVRRA